MKLTIGILAASTLLLSQAALAATVTSGPGLSGTYLITYVETCQASFSWGTDPSTGDINTINSVDDGKISTTTGTALFNQTAGRVHIQGFEEIGDLLIIQEHGGNVMADKPFDLTTGYNVTANSIILGGVRYHASFSPSTGTANQVVFSGISSGGGNGNCAVTGTGSLVQPAVATAAHN
jgi:hypothetical protein